MINKFIDKFRSINAKDSVVLKNIILAFVVKGGSLVVSFAMMPAFINYFSDQKILGVWYTVLSVISWIMNFDLGIGNGLRNRLTVSYSCGDMKKSKSLVSSAYVFFGVTIVFIIVIGYFAVGFINWNDLLNIPTTLINSTEMLIVIRCVFVGVVLQFFFRLINSVLYAIQKAAVNNAIVLLVSVMQLAFIVVAPSKTPQENLLLLSRAYVFIASAPYVAATVILFSSKLKEIRPSVKCCNIASMKEVMGIGGEIFICQVLYMIIMNTNDFFITAYTSPDKVVDYNIYYKIFSLTGTLLFMVLTPLWSMITKALAEKDYEWTKKLYRKCAYMVCIAGIGQVGILVLLKPLLRLWLGANAIEVNYLYAGIFAVWSIVFIIHNVLSTFACGIGKMKIQLVCYSIGVVFKLVFLYVVFKYTDNWIYVVISNIILLLPYCVWQHFGIKNEFKTRKENNDV